MTKTYEEINEKIRARKAVVVTAEEMITVVAEKGVKGAARDVDVVTTGTFGAMCSSGALLNVGHSSPRIKIQRAWLNGVPVNGGLAAVDMYLGATALAEGDPANEVHPGRFAYGGGHVIEDLVRGREIALRAEGYGTDCYPRREMVRKVTLQDIPDAVLLNPRNAYQNYNVAVNVHSDRPIWTYLGKLDPGLVNAGYSSAGQLSPLLNDPFYRTIGIGTRIFLGGGTGYVSFQGTQHNPGVSRTPNGVPDGGAGTLAVTGDLKQMSARYLKGLSFKGYGVSIAVGLGIPIPILDEEMARFTAVSNAEIMAPVVDYSEDYPNGQGEPLGHVSYAELRSGEFTFRGRPVRTSSSSSYARASEVATELKRWITEGSFQLGRPVELLPDGGARERFGSAQHDLSAYRGVAR